MFLFCESPNSSQQLLNYDTFCSTHYLVQTVFYQRILESQFQFFCFVDCCGLEKLKSSDVSSLKEAPYQASEDRNDVVDDSRQPRGSRGRPVRLLLPGVDVVGVNHFDLLFVCGGRDPGRPVVDVFFVLFVEVV